MAKINGVMRASPELTKDLIEMKSDMEKAESKNITISEVTKRITKTPSWKKVKDELKLNRQDIDLRR